MQAPRPVAAPVATAKTVYVAPAIAAVLVISFLTTLYKPGIVDFLALVPGNVVPQIWTLFTYAFLDNDIPEVRASTQQPRVIHQHPPPQLVLSVVGVLFTARVLESAWGTVPLLQYVAIVALSSGCAVFVTCLALYLAAPTANSKLLYTDLAGFHGVLGALLVGIKQALPDKEAKLFSFVKIPSKYLPGLYLLASMALGLVVGRVVEVAALVLFAQYAGWWYLRFLQPHQDGSRGDGSEEFRFATLFPPVMHAPIDTLAAACSRVLRVFPVSRAPAPTPLPVSTPLGIGGAGLDASRRRERGARVLEERLGMKPRPAGLVAAPSGFAPNPSPAGAADLEPTNGHV